MRRCRRLSRVVLATAALASVAAALATVAGGHSPQSETAYQDLEARIIEIAEQVKPSVVHIEAIVRINDRRHQVTGSGVIASKDGRILTNQHVVDRAEKVTVSVPGRKKKYPARIIGTDPQTDIAVLRIESDEPFSEATFSKQEVRVGQWVLAVGNPYGLDGTVSFGIVSAKGRNLEIPDTLNDFIQTDAMIDRGSSGGPLVDLNGKVVGINSRGQGRGIGFTIPIKTALEVARALEEGGIERGYLGITMQPLDRELAEYFGQPQLTGAVVNSVLEDSPAARAGVQIGDVIHRFNDTVLEPEKVEDLGAFQRLVAGVEPGDEAVLEIVRNGKHRRIRVKIAVQPKIEPDEEETDDGFHVQEVTANLARDHRLGDETGAFVTFVSSGSPASEAGLLVSDVINRIEKYEVADLRDFRDAMERISDQSRFLITARRGDETKFLLVKRGVLPTLPEVPENDAEKASHPRPDPRRE